MTITKKIILIALIALTGNLTATSIMPRESRDVESTYKTPQTLEELEKAGRKRALKEAEVEDQKIQKRHESFKQLGPLIEKITEKSMLMVFEGLPHQFYNPKQLAAELKSKETVTSHGFAFYKDTIQISEVEAGRLKDLIKDAGSFSKFGGRKLCGGFHPDFSLVWSTAGEPIEIQVRLGCHEIKAYQGKVEVNCDIDAKAYELLKVILQNNHKHLPKPENEG